MPLATTTAYAEPPDPSIATKSIESKIGVNGVHLFMGEVPPEPDVLKPTRPQNRREPSGTERAVAVMIQASHDSIHTWPDHGYAAVDLLYCGGTVRVHKALEVSRERFKPQRIKFLVVRRGLEGEVSR